MLDHLGRGTSAVNIQNICADFFGHLCRHPHALGLTTENLHRKGPPFLLKPHLAFDFGVFRVSPSTEINSETVRPIPPRAFSRRRNEISVTPAIGDNTNGGLISTLRILKGLVSIIKTISNLTLSGRRCPMYHCSCDSFYCRNEFETRNDTKKAPLFVCVRGFNSSHYGVLAIKT